MKTKKSLGTKFLEKFIDYREKDPNAFTFEVDYWLRSRGILVIRQAAGEDLLTDYFGYQSNTLQIGTIEPDKPVIVGKGVCYDSGGYDLKTNMNGMHFDRNGALLAIAASLDTGVPAKAFFVSNMIRPDSPVAGDILVEPITGKRILIENTDAEGRIGLAALLADVNRITDKAITIATLTGAAVAVTGERTYALVHSTEPYDLTECITSDLELWPAPYHKDYDKAVKTKVKGADITNSSKYKGAGSSTAFSFLKEFFNGHLIHVDMAAMTQDKDGNGLVWGLQEIKALIKLF